MNKNIRSAYLFEDKIIFKMDDGKWAWSSRRTPFKYTMYVALRTYCIDHKGIFCLSFKETNQILNGEHEDKLIFKRTY